MTQTILIVDDDPVDALAIRRIVARLKLDATIEHVEDGERALGWLARQQTMPCCILLDLNMPRLDGREFLKLMRAEPRTKSVPVYIVTTSSRDEDIVACHESGFSGYILKSTDLELFSTNITTAVREVHDLRSGVAAG